MSLLLAEGLEHPEFRDKDLAKQFGYGAPFASAYRSWLHKAGIVELRFPITLTELGAVVQRMDPKFDKEPTLWLLHQELVTDPERAEAWNFFMGEFRAAHPQFSKEELRAALAMKLSAHDAKHFGPKSKMIPIIARKLLECYTSAQALGGLGLLNQRDSGWYEFSEPVTSQAFSSVAELEVAY